MATQLNSPVSPIRKSIRTLALLMLASGGAQTVVAAPSCNTTFGPPGGGTLTSGATNTGSDACLSNATAAVISPGSVTNTASAKLTSVGAFTIGYQGQFNNYGRFVNASGAVMTNQGVTRNYSGAVFTNEAGATFSNTLTSGDLVNDAGASFINSGVLNSSKWLRNSGTFVNNAGGSLNSSSSLQNRTGAQLTNHGALTINGLTENAAGAQISNYGTLTVRTSSGSIYNRGTLVNEVGGTLQTVPGTSGTANETLYNYAGATLRNKGTLLLGVPSGSSPGPWYDVKTSNFGTMVNEAGGTVKLSGSMTNKASGLLENFGSFAFVSSLINEGVVANRAGGSMTNVRATNRAGASIINDGFMNVQSLEIVEGSAVTGSGTLQTTGVLVVNGSVTQDVVSIEGGRVYADGVIAADVTVTGGGELRSYDGKGATIVGDLSIDGGTLSAQIGGLTDGSFSVFDVDGAVNLTSGTFDFFVMVGNNGWYPAAGDSWRFLNGDIQGSLQNFNFTFRGGDGGPLQGTTFITEIVDGGLELRVVSSVPVPAAAWSFATGLFCLGGIARRRARSSK